MNGDYIVGTIVATPLSHVRQGSDMSHELRSPSEAERKTYLTVKTFTLRIFFSPFYPVRLFPYLTQAE